MISRQDWQDYRAGEQSPRFHPINWRAEVRPLWPLAIAFALAGLCNLPGLSSGGVLALGVPAVIVAVLGMFRWIVVLGAYRYRSREASKLRRPCPWCGQGEEDGAATEAGER